MVKEFTPDRYSRQLPLIGEEGQEKLQKSTVLVVGAGGLGSSVLLYLAAAGIGRLLIVDRGYVDLPDLNRQVLYLESDLGKAKARTAAERLGKLNSSIEISGYAISTSDSQFEALVEISDVVVDCLDNWTSRFTVNDLAVKYVKPLVHAGVQEFYGQVTTVIPGLTPCLRCLMPRAAETSGIIPVLGFTPAVLGAIEASEVVKLLVWGKPSLAGQLLVVDLKNMEFSKIKIVKRPDCPACGVRDKVPTS
ncbi:MAG: HesA/MoeB/ThiF family protein [Sulfolobales archaeon]|nr:HesA/MoeB/ThiF family protein [Sulfolobales archaeon]MDW8082634.1 HesA/MoeB/ThiF family protein [Sulfolobales archaeon]